MRSIVPFEFFKDTSQIINLWKLHSVRLSSLFKNVELKYYRACLGYFTIFGSLIAQLCQQKQNSDQLTRKCVASLPLNLITTCMQTLTSHVYSKPVVIAANSYKSIIFQNTIKTNQNSPE